MNTLWQQVLKGRCSRKAARCAAAALVLAASSCNSVQRPLAKTVRDPFLDEQSHTVAASQPADENSRMSPPTVVSPSAAVRQAGYETLAGDEGRRRESAAIQRVNAEPRLPEFAACPVVDESPAASAKLYPDEYLFDGGDREHPIHYDDYQMLGLDTEDAAVEYRDERGARRVKATNRVAIYAPRFAAVTSVSEPIEDVGGGRPAQAVGGQAGLGFVNREGTFAQHQRDMTERFVSRSRGSGLTSEIASDALDRQLALRGHVHTTTPLEDFGFLRTGQVHQTDEPRLAASIQSAVVWSRDQNPVITAQSDSAGELRSRFEQQEMVGQENRLNGKGKLRIVKLADKAVAQPGDIVTFTIRFDNIGDREVRDVVIVDNLTPRLEYVEDSATLDREGAFVTEDNGEGSLVLKWVLDDPLAGRKGGVATFQARVR